MTSPEPFPAGVPAASWRKSSHSAANNECVEIARLSRSAYVRDSKETAGPVLTFGADAFAAFLNNTKRADLGYTG